MKELIAHFSETITIKRNEFLNENKILDTNVYHIVSGSVMIFVLDNFEERIVRFGYKGNLITSLDSFLKNKPSNYYIKAIKKTVLKVITKQQFYEIMDNESGKEYWISLLENLVLEQLDREIDILITSPKKRYERVLKRSPELFREIPNKHIANYLRMSPETLCRLKNLDLNQ